MTGDMSFITVKWICGLSIDVDLYLCPKGKSQYDSQYRCVLDLIRICVCIQGWSPRLMDALWFGCVPVIISDRYVLPLADMLNWDDIAYRIPESQVSNN